MTADRMAAAAAADLQQDLNPSSLSPPLKQADAQVDAPNYSPLSTGDHLGAAYWLVDCWWTALEVS